MKFKKTFLYELAEPVDSPVANKTQEQQDRQFTQVEKTLPSSRSQNEKRKVAQKQACPENKVIKEYDSFSA